VQKVQCSSMLLRMLGLPKRKIERGQIVVYYTPHDPETIAVKRVVGIPGDRVKPLLGYPGGDDEGIVIPYNHIWVEGDANSREKSIDSNYFGPISQSMVYGYALGVWTSWLSWPVRLRWEDDDYPAKKSGRVEKDVVKNAKLDPDEEVKQSRVRFTTNKAALELAMIRKHRDDMPRRLRNETMLKQYTNMYALAMTELEIGDANTRDVAEGLVDELEVAFESVGLKKDGSRLVPPSDNNAVAG